MTAYVVSPLMSEQEMRRKFALLDARRRCWRRNLDAIRTHDWALADRWARAITRLNYMCVNYDS